MSGCDWQNKSFTVAASNGSSITLCAICKAPITGTISKLNGDTLCKGCFGKNTVKRLDYATGAGPGIKIGKTLEMVRNGESFYSETCPESYKVNVEMAKRREQGKPIDGRCFKDAGEKLKEIRKKGLM